MPGSINLKDCSCCRMRLTAADVNFIGYTTDIEPVLWFICKACTTTVVVTAKYEYFEKLKAIFAKETG
jgi:hypothetical protein